MGHRAGVVQEDQVAADGVDGDIDAAVVVVVGGGEPATVRAQPAQDVRVGERPAGLLREHLDGPGILREVRDRDRPIREHEVEPPVVVQVDP